MAPTRPSLESDYAVAGDATMGESEPGIAAAGSARSAIIQRKSAFVPNNPPDLRCSKRQRGWHCIRVAPTLPPRQHRDDRQQGWAGRDRRGALQRHDCRRVRLTADCAPLLPPLWPFLRWPAAPLTPDPGTRTPSPTADPL